MNKVDRPFYFRLGQSSSETKKNLYSYQHLNKSCVLLRNVWDLMTPFLQANLIHSLLPCQLRVSSSSKQSLETFSFNYSFIISREPIMALLHIFHNYHLSTLISFDINLSLCLSALKFQSSLLEIS